MNYNLAFVVDEFRLARALASEDPSDMRLGVLSVILRTSYYHIRFTLHRPYAAAAHDEPSPYPHPPITGHGHKAHNKAAAEAQAQAQAQAAQSAGIHPGMGYPHPGAYATRR